MITIQNLKWGIGSWTSSKLLSIAISNHSLVILKGNNGSGKTSLLKTLHGCFPVISGDFANTFRKSVFLPTENYGLLPDLSVSENLIFISKIRGHHQQESQFFLNQMLSNFFIDSIKSKKYKNCSRGERQWIHIMGTLMDPSCDLIFMDEPFNFIDSEKRIWLSQNQNLILPEDKPRTIVLSVQRIQELPWNLDMMKYKVQEVNL